MSNTFDERTISELQAVRKVNSAVLACAQILGEHGANEGSMPSVPRAFLQLDVMQETGLLCSKVFVAMQVV